MHAEVYFLLLGSTPYNFQSTPTTKKPMQLGTNYSTLESVDNTSYLKHTKTLERNPAEMHAFGGIAWMFYLQQGPQAFRR